MNTFFKTFFICLFIAVAFFAYKFVLNDSYSADLTTSKDSKVFGVHTPVEEKEYPKKEVVEPSQKAPEPLKQEEKKYSYICYFYNASGQLVPIERKLAAPATLENTIVLLLKGPTITETKRGIHSEIPLNVDLISIKNTDKSLIVNLSSNFGNGGGSESVENRVKQISKTVKRLVPNKSVYLYIDNKEVEYLGGEGVYVKQPLD